MEALLTVILQALFPMVIVGPLALALTWPKD